MHPLRGVDIGSVSRSLSWSEIALACIGVGLALAAQLAGADSIATGLLTVIVVWSVAWVVIVFAHELGHAVAAVALTGQRVLIRMGGEPYLLRFALGRIDVRLHPTGPVAHCELSPANVPPWRLVVIALAGPAVSVALGAALVPLASDWPAGSPIPPWLVGALAGCSVTVGVANAIPFRRLPKWWTGSLESETGPSDGFLALVALRALRSRPETEETEETEETDPEGRRYPASEEVLRATARAAEEARLRASGHIGTEHLLVGVMEEAGSPASRLLARFGVTQEGVRRHLAEAVGPPPDEVRLTPAAKRAIAAAGRALTLRGDARVTTEHLLVGLLQERDGLMIQVLRQSGVDVDELRRQALAALA